ncbi:hypothetical protein [Bradyrhizobium japonicum]|uniref:hypothetical protein n=1 Tax=Bradyrhizobium japonicum TaxID=375 RepID=UPI00041D970F|nr:hypothetical protein [Bradyrhizobium japonicum]
MKPTHNYTGHATFDLTEGKIHRITSEDGKTRIVALFPKAWKAGAPQSMSAVNGQTVTMRPYHVTEWEEIELRPVGE